MNKTQKLVLLGIYTGISLILFTVESAIPAPIPVPGVKLGLANIVSVIVLISMGLKSALSVSIVRCILSAVITGQVGALIYSLAGSLFSVLAMRCCLSLISEKQYFVISVIGGIIHNLSQLLAAILITNTPGLAVYAPVLIISGIAAGLFTGLTAQFFLNHFSKIRPS